MIFDVVGPSADTIKNMIKCDNPVQYGINCHGRLSHENTLSIVKKADFSVLMRENKRYAKAGVSTKFVEAMSLAVPSICTAVGGTDAFVSDCVDGFLIKDNSVYEILDKLELIVNMDSSEILQMKLNALNKAKHVFSEDQYFEVTKLFLKGKVLDSLKKHNNKATIMLSSSIQATLSGRFGNSEYGRSKKAGEELFFDYAKETGAKVAVYRFPNLMGHSRPKYNSAVSTFCWAVANDEPFTVNDRSTELELLYIDDLVEGMFDLLENKEQHCEFNGVETVASKFEKN